MAGADERMVSGARRAQSPAMTTGALIFAFDNEQIDYLAMAAWNAHNIRRHLQLPVCVVTDSTTVPEAFDRVIQVPRTPSDARRTFADINGPVTWYNHDRIDAYALSPWQETLVLDADYVVASSQLRDLPLSANRDFWCCSRALDVSRPHDIDHEFNYFGQYRMPMSWATVMYFRRSDTVQRMFDTMRMIRTHWTHYRDIYGFGRSVYRNDFALTIALGVVNGHIAHKNKDSITMINVMPDHSLCQEEPDQYRVGWRDSGGKPRHIRLKHTDFHAMCKGQLGAIVAHNS